MSRWRPPSREKSSPYITGEGLERLQQEYDHLWRFRRPEVVRALAAAAAEGDRSENAEYQYRKKELGEIDRRVRYLQRRLPELRVPPPPDDPSRIRFGACVRIEIEDEAEKELRLVGPDEANPSLGAVSIDAPLARALIGARVGDAVVIAPDGVQQSVSVLALHYQVG